MKPICLDMIMNTNAIKLGLVFLPLAVCGQGDPLDTWSVQGRLPITPYRLTSLAYGNGQYIGVGDYPDFSGTPGALILTSSNAVNWVQRQGPTNLVSDLYFNNVTGSRIAYGNGQFVAVGWGYNEQSLVVISSTDGSMWAERFVG